MVTAETETITVDARQRGEQILAVVTDGTTVGRLHAASFAEIEERLVRGGYDFPRTPAECEQGGFAADWRAHAAEPSTFRLEAAR